ncbi:hypothetical protein BV898_09555 [Hypsibius exemplaris]|uniref:Protein sleepless n=1 Tax=Hypsibius exemplaris TaxID=2072580 RepID=A0A1W0WM11_HYPEX|nr:hypothetical protein BV898_09555 [Hypsibius exemplaris]
MAAKHWIILAIAFACTVASVSAISCYECNSSLNPGCSDSSQISQSYKDCSTLPGRDRCMKSRGPGSIVIRACASSNGRNAVDGCTTNANNIETCICSSNYCNGSSGSSVVSFLTIIVSALLCFFF